MTRTRFRRTYSLIHSTPIFKPSCVQSITSLLDKRGRGVPPIELDLSPRERLTRGRSCCRRAAYVRGKKIVGASGVQRCITSMNTNCQSSSGCNDQVSATQQKDNYSRLEGGQTSILCAHCLWHRTARRARVHQDAVAAGLTLQGRASRQASTVYDRPFTRHKTKLEHPQHEIVRSACQSASAAQVHTYPVLKTWPWSLTTSYHGEPGNLRSHELCAHEHDWDSREDAGSAR